MDSPKNIEAPFVAVFMVTYNHEEYISQAIEGVINQKTNFKIKLYIGEDCSTDNTRAICMDYVEKYPEIISLICTKENNLWTNVRNVYSATFNSGAKYIAMCEGDDYWIDENKLQKQYDFLEANPDFSLCFTDYEVVNELNEHENSYIPLLDFSKDVFTIEDFICPPSGNRFTARTVTMFFRNCIGYPLPDFYFKALYADMALVLLLGTKGKFKFIMDKSAAYRRHTGGITQTEEYQMKGVRSQFDMFDNFNEYSDFKYHESIKKLLFPASKTLLIYESGFQKGKERRKHIFRMIKGYFRYMDKFYFKEIAYYTIVLFFPFIIKFYKKVNHIK